MIGEVVSTKMPKMVIVSVTQIRRHPLYRKAIRKTKRFSADNQSIELIVGDHVEITETKPMSKTKHFKVIKKL